MPIKPEKQRQIIGLYKDDKLIPMKFSNRLTPT